MKKFLITFIAVAIVTSASMAQHDIANQERRRSVKETIGVVPQAVYAELGGNSFLYSVTYERGVSKQLNGLGVRGGLGLMSLYGDTFISVPVGLTYLLGKRGSYFEMGAGMTMLRFPGDDKKKTRRNSSIVSGLHGNHAGDVYHYHEKSSSIGFGGVFDKPGYNLYGTLNVGYRAQPIRGGFLFRAGITAYYGLDGDGQFFFWPFVPGISLGYSF